MSSSLSYYWRHMLSSLSHTADIMCDHLYHILLTSHVIIKRRSWWKCRWAQQTIMTRALLTSELQSKFVGMFAAVCPADTTFCQNFLVATSSSLPFRLLLRAGVRPVICRSIQRKLYSSLGGLSSAMAQCVCVWRVASCVKWTPRLSTRALLGAGVDSRDVRPARNSSQRSADEFLWFSLSLTTWIDNDVNYDLLHSYIEC